MAKRHSIAASLVEAEPHDATPQEAATEAATQEAVTGEAPQEPAGAPRRARRPRKAAPAAPAPQEVAQGDSAVEPIRPTVLIAPTTADARRVGLYLHEDDFKALGLAKLEDGADANSRIRAMIAVWRANPRFQTQVDRLARTAPKGR